jgi:hypothetical protein
MSQPPNRIVRSATVFVEAFGRRSTTSDANGLINAEEEDLYSVFHARSVLMSWYGADRATQRPMAWHMHEAEITADADKLGPGTPRIAYAQVGLEPHPAEIVLRLPAIIQCFHDAVRRFGHVDLSSIQVTATSITPGPPSCLMDLISSRNWFNTTANARVNATIAFDQETLGNHAETRPFSRLQDGVGPQFTFGPLTDTSESHRISVPDEVPFLAHAQPSDTALPVTLPEWTPSSIGWALAAVADCVRTASVDLENIIVRITRTD